MFEKVFEIGMLYDFYGKLLTPKQSNFLEMYYENNLTLSEIAENLNISRQAVHDTLRKVELILHEYENNLGLIEKFHINQGIMEDINNKLDELLNSNSKTGIIDEIISNIKKDLDKINI